jgi:hypothetical protein
MFRLKNWFCAGCVEYFYFPVHLVIEMGPCTVQAANKTKLSCFFFRLETCIAS